MRISHSKSSPAGAPAPVAGSVRAAPDTPIGLYVHIPFCETKCPYCDFNTYAGIESMVPAYVEGLRREIDLWGRFLGRPEVSTVFFGGGTPSYLPPDRVALLMRGIGEAFDVLGGGEVTLEANPGDLSEKKLERYLELGVNRLSIGVQSFDDRLLGVLGRRHSADEAVQAYRMALDAGFDNVSIDLMYGLPHQSLDDWERTLSRAEGLAPHHLSMYCLTLEGGTPMERWVDDGRMPEPDPDLAADMYLMAQDALAHLGYRHYEISNWAMPGKESAHNLTYWRNRPYLGVGPGAHSYLAGHRFHNLRSPAVYIRRLSGGGPDIPNGLDADAMARMPAVEGVDAINRSLEMAETMIMGLRLDTGIEVAEFARRFAQTPTAAFGDAIEELVAVGLLDSSEASIRLTPRGRLLGNEVFSRFVA